MLLKKERLKEVENSRLHNLSWKEEVAKQILEKELQRQKEKRQNQELSRVEEEKIRKYQQQISERVSEGNYSRGKRDRVGNQNKSSQAREELEGRKEKVNASHSVYLKHEKDLRVKTNPGIKVSFNAGHQEETPLFEFADNDNPERVSGNKISKARNLATHEDDLIVLSFPEQPRKKERKSTSKKRQETVNSRRNTETSNVFEVEALEQENKKLKEELLKSNSIIDSLIRMIKSQSGSEQMSKNAESILLGNEIGQTEYIRFEHNSFQAVAVNKAMFPSLNFKSSSLIRDFNLGAAKKAASLTSSQTPLEMKAQ